MRPLLPATFFDRPADAVARDLLGCTLCVERDGPIERHTINETEAYLGPEDKACHAAKGRTKRTEIMFQKPGTIYVYLIYGMYDMLNIVTDAEEHPAAVLIRGAGSLNGPGKLTKALGITRELNGAMLGKATGLWIEERAHTLTEAQIITTPRIGISYAGEWAEKELRFILST